MKSILKSLVTALLIVAIFFFGVQYIDDWMAQESRRALEQELEQAAEHIAANALYQIEVGHVGSVMFDAAMVQELLS